jgi:lipid-A-disaccharide synthase
MLVAGEASGDKHGAALAFALRNASSGREVQLFGAGGKEMRAAGVDTVVDSMKLGIIGIPEIIRALPRFYTAYRNLVRAAEARQADAVVLIDWPDFNLRLARRLNRDGFKVVYYISPQVWAWRRYRVRAIRRSVRRMLVILPFEQDFYRQEGVEAEYVGHPLSGAVRITRSREEFSRVHGLDPRRPIIALLPGSRQKELYYHLPVMAEAAARLEESSIDWAVTGSLDDSIDYRAGTGNGPQFVMPLASTVERPEVEAMLGPALDRLKLIEEDGYNALGHSVAAVVASGTATVEAALLGVPMVIIYRGSELNWRLIRPLIRLDTFGMANLIAGERIVPELIQHEATPARIVSELASILSDRKRFAQIKEKLALVSARLGSGGIAPSEVAARRIMEIALGEL